MKIKFTYYFFITFLFAISILSLDAMDRGSRAHGRPVHGRESERLPNLLWQRGNCYVDSVIQALYHTPTFREKLLQLPDPITSPGFNSFDQETGRIINNLLQSLKRVFRGLDRKTDRVNAGDVFNHLGALFDKVKTWDVEHQSMVYWFLGDENRRNLVSHEWAGMMSSNPTITLSLILFAASFISDFHKIYNIGITRQAQGIDFLATTDSCLDWMRTFCGGVAYCGRQLWVKNTNPYFDMPMRLSEISLHSIAKTKTVFDQALILQMPKILIVDNGDVFGMNELFVNNGIKLSPSNFDLTCADKPWNREYTYNLKAVVLGSVDEGHAIAFVKYGAYWYVLNDHMGVGPAAYSTPTVGPFLAPSGYCGAKGMLEGTTEELSIQDMLKHFSRDSNINLKYKRFAETETMENIVNYGVGVCSGHGGLYRPQIYFFERDDTDNNPIVIRGPTRTPPRGAGSSRARPNVNVDVTGLSVLARLLHRAHESCITLLQKLCKLRDIP